MAKRLIGARWSSEAMRTESEIVVKRIREFFDSIPAMTSIVGYV